MIHVVLESPSHPGNIGSVARAMKTTGLEHLVLFSPKEFPSEEANKLATHGIKILENARVIDNLERFIYEMDLVVACTKRSRKIAIDQYDVRTSAQITSAAHQSDQHVALLFGNETTGLSNEIVESCHHILEIPMHCGNDSLNLSHAVQVALYEIQQALNARQSVYLPQHEMPCADEKEHFEKTLAQVIENTGFIKHRGAMDRIYAMLRRMRPDRRELQLLFGLLNHVSGQNTGDTDEK